MTPRQWLQLTCSYHTDLERKSNALAGHATRLSAEFPARAFNADTARAAAKLLHATAGYADIATALRHVMPARDVPTNESEELKVARCWDRYIGRRLSEGGPRAHLLSLLKACCPEAHLRPVLETHFPAELAEMDAKDRRIAEHQAKLRRMAEEAARRMRAEQPPRSRPVQPEPALDVPKARYLSPEHLAATRARLGIKPKDATP